MYVVPFILQLCDQRVKVSVKTEVLLVGRYRSLRKPRIRGRSLIWSAAVAASAGQDLMSAVEAG